jgi:hypothetical protein
VELAPAKDVLAGVNRRLGEAGLREHDASLDRWTLHSFNDASHLRGLAPVG